MVNSQTRNSGSNSYSRNFNSNYFTKSPLQSSLHSLLVHLTSTSKIIQQWPDSQGDNASIHIDTTTKLIQSLQKIIESVKNVEDKSLTRLTTDSKEDLELKKNLREYQVPMDLLDLMDYGHVDNDLHHLFGLNPDCFIRGLLREALRQMAGLKRRKVALEMLGKAVEKGMKERKRKSAKKNEITAISKSDIFEKKGVKRGRKDLDDDTHENMDSSNHDTGEPPTKRAASCL